ncbi:TolC family protein [Herbaspirillum sp. RV1423]|uniref:TolC family protein n=1 Tax=Herbaspirillum sp. RV1423 TaxID=1443993 RepID=UPI0027952C77|nr:TolC family protein [Herbaspirillum sp. RV1423]
MAILLAHPAYAQSIAAGNDRHASAFAPNAGANPSGDSPTLQAAIDLALERNKELSAARLEIEAVEATIIQAGARPNPEISALMEDTRKSTRTTTYQLNQPIELGGKRSARIEAAQRAHDIAVLEFSVKRAEIRSGVTAAYFETLIAQERLRLAEDLLKLTERSTAMTARRVSAGKISPVEETKARVADASARLALGQASSDLTLARKRLTAYWGDFGSTLTPAVGNVETMPALPAITGLIDRVNDGPAIKLARLEVERRRALAKIESAKRIPDLTVSLGSKRDEEARRNMWVVGVSIPIPVFDSNKGNELEAIKRVDKARDEQAATEIRIQGEAAQSYERMRNAVQEVDALRRDIIPGAESAYGAAAKGFELGKFSFLEVLDAQRTYFQAKSQYWQALSNVHQASAELDRLAGPNSTEKE